jgi:hypothetical protein
VGRGTSARIKAIVKTSSTLSSYLFYFENNVNQEKGDRPETASGLPHLGTNSSFKQYGKVGYEDAKAWMERRLAGMKSGVPNWAATAMATEW